MKNKDHFIPEKERNLFQYKLQLKDKMKSNNIHICIYTHTIIALESFKHLSMVNYTLEKTNAHDLYHKAKSEIKKFNQTQELNRKNYQEMHEDNSHFSQCYRQFQDANENKNSKIPTTLHIPKAEESFIEIIAMYTERGYNIPDLSVKRNLFQPSPLLMSNCKIRDFYKYHANEPYHHDHKKKFSGSSDENKSEAFLERLQTLLTQKKGQKEMNRPAKLENEIAKKYVPYSSKTSSFTKGMPTNLTLKELVKENKELKKYNLMIKSNLEETNTKPSNLYQNPPQILIKEKPINLTQPFFIHTKRISNQSEGSIVSLMTTTSPSNEKTTLYSLPTEADEKTSSKRALVSHNTVTSKGINKPANIKHKFLFKEIVNSATHYLKNPKMTDIFSRKDKFLAHFTGMNLNEKRLTEVEGIVKDYCEIGKFEKEKISSLMTRTGDPSSLMHMIKNIQLKNEACNVRDTMKNLYHRSQRLERLGMLNHVEELDTKIRNLDLKLIKKITTIEKIDKNDL